MANLGYIKQVFIASFIFVIVLVVLHESGHYVAGKYYNAYPKFSYVSVSYYDIDKIISTQRQSDEDIIQTLFNSKLSPAKSKNLTLAGILTTNLIGLFCFCLLMFKTNKSFTYMSKWDKILLFGSFSFIRNIHIPTISYYKLALNNKFPSCDEIKVFNYYEVPSTIGLTSMLVFGAAVLGFICFRFVARENMIAFVSTSFVGSMLSIIFWTKFLGPLLFEENL